ncbi:MAG TPA: SET domain-containing protein-lysine N-methyltransferase [Streptosporangiaceae bacterium]
MSVSSYITGKAVKGQASGIQGRGLFATEPIQAGEIVAIKGGHIVGTATLRGLPARLRNSEIQIADGFHLVALADDEYEPVMLFINHSCEPNVGFAGNVVLVAMRDIGTGEELTTDYALFDDCDEQMECGCGAARCRGVIHGRDWHRPDLQRKYGGYFSAYLRARMPGRGEQASGSGSASCG